MSDIKPGEDILTKTVAAIAGVGTEKRGGKTEALGGVDLEKAKDNGGAEAVRLIRLIAEASNVAGSTSKPGDGSSSTGLRERTLGLDKKLSADQASGSGTKNLSTLVKKGVQTFVDYYSSNHNREKAREVVKLFQEGIDPELLAEEISLVWTPELRMKDEEILPKWKLKNLKPNPTPLQPSEIVIQLNALYTGPETIPRELPPELAEEGRRVMDNPGKKIADYDHPVPLFESGEGHELEICLRDLETDISFEKEREVIPQDHKVPILLSVSVTHEGIDELAGKWIKSLVKQGGYKNLELIVLTEGMCRRIREELLGGHFEMFSVFGSYGRHFTALKYSQLLLEKALGVRAGFKLDTDEGIRSRDLYKATGKTWFETMCHPYWGGSAFDPSGNEVELAFNEGEYVNSSDINRLGYENALRTPDVSVPDTWTGSSMFFQKGFAHGRATALYNRFDSLEEGISHPVVKGGGYGITNSGLRKAAPFTFSWVGRAEDQQFYFSGLKGGLRGIFNPDLRIAHYKGTVAGAEKKTAAGRFLGDMYRLVLFRHIVERWDIKEDLDPMPGVFAGPLAEAQAAFSLLYKIAEFAEKGNREAAEYLTEEGAWRLVELEERIEDGTVDRLLESEAGLWKRFIEAVEKTEDKKVQKVLGL